MPAEVNKGRGLPMAVENSDLQTLCRRVTTSGPSCSLACAVFFCA
jgi:hypothetical protein